MLIKICGITTRGDAVAAVQAGASAIGFNFYPGSPRYVTPESAAQIGDGLPVIKVGVFVDEPVQKIAKTAARAHLDVVQLHGAEPPQNMPPGLRTWKAFRVRTGWNREQLNAYDVEAFLLDGPAPGTGAAFDWDIAAGLTCRFILAGGIGPDNVAAAIRALHPYGVDACSKLESSPGVKDHTKMRQFIEAALSESNS